MKILSIYFKNINSLQGEHLIDFRQAPLANAAVFAITGPNGSGKTSILDAITLALYGETFRFDRPAEYVMTQHTTECFAQVDFRVNNQHYRSRWGVQRNGEVLSPVYMQLLCLADEEQILAEEVLHVRKQVTEIVGLDFRNFTRSTLLAQGDFAAFLNALDSERLDILEKIVSSDIYVDYKQEVIANAEAAQLKLEQLQTDLHAIPLLDAATQEASELDLADFKAQRAEYESLIKDLSQQINGLKALAQVDQQLQHQQQNQRQLVQQQQEVSTALQRVSQFQSLSVLTNEFNHIETLSGNLQQDQQVLAEYRQELAHLKAQIESLGISAQTSILGSGRSLAEQQEIISALTFQADMLQNENRTEMHLLQTLEQQFAEKKSLEAGVKQWLIEHDRDAILLDGFPEIARLKKLGADIVELKNQQKTYAKWTKDTSAKRKSTKSIVLNLQSEAPAIQNQIVRYETELASISRGLSLEALTEVRAVQLAKVKDYKDLLQLANIHSRFQDGLLVRLGLVKRPQELDETGISERLQRMNTQLQQEENIKKSLEHAAFNESLLKKMQADRVHLVNGEPCPLCGSLKHPFVTEPPQAIDSAQALAAQKTRVQSMSIAIARVQQQLKTAQKQVQDKQLKSDRLIRVHSDWATLCNRLNIVSSELNINNKRLMKRLLKEQVVEYQDLEQIYKKARSYQQKITKAKQQLEKQTGKLAQMQAAAMELEASFANKPQELTVIEQKLAQLEAEEKPLGDKVLAQLERLQEKMPAKGKEDALFDRLNLRRQEYQMHQVREKNLAEDIKELQQKITEGHGILIEQQQRIQECLAKLRVEQGGGVELAVIEKQRLISDKEAQIAQSQTQIHALKQQLQTQALSAGLADYNALAEVLKLLPEQANLQQQQQSMQTRLQELAEGLAQLQQQKQNEFAWLLNSKSLAELEAEYKSFKEKSDIAHLEIDRLESLLDKQQQRREKYNDVADRVAEQQAQLVLCQRELQIVQQENGHAFRRKVQRRMADKLLTQTNLMLEKISGRFYVRQRETEQGLALEIEDTYQQNTRRLPKTLSGGEGFVVSLALALGLSELASNGQAIESLFLDEGFGNLDADALYTVVSTLEGLQTQGKKVGVISHVEGVRKRIKTQIEMIKKPNGLSELRSVM